MNVACSVNATVATIMMTAANRDNHRFTEPRNPIPSVAFQNYRKKLQQSILVVEGCNNKGSV